MLEACDSPPLDPKNLHEGLGGEELQQRGWFGANSPLNGAAHGMLQRCIIKQLSGKPSTQQLATFWARPGVFGNRETPGRDGSHKNKIK